MLTEDENAKVEGTGSGFIWDKFGHIVCMQLFSFYVINSKTCLWQMWSLLGLHVNEMIKRNCFADQYKLET
jgi:hypothetical protein